MGSGHLYVKVFSIPSPINRMPRTRKDGMVRINEITMRFPKRTRILITYLRQNDAIRRAGETNSKLWKISSITGMRRVVITRLVEHRNRYTELLPLLINHCTSIIIIIESMLQKTIMERVPEKNRKRQRPMKLSM